MSNVRRDPEDLFSEVVEKIQQAYESLEHELGWRFLYSPASTLSTDTQILFVGSNPGGKYYEAPIASVEEGNAYRVERWPRERKDGKLNPLQTQVHRLYEILSGNLNQSSATELLDQTLTSNLCPFRSSRWHLLPRKEESLAFSNVLWSSILEYTLPPVIICLGHLPFGSFEDMLLGMGFEKTIPTQREPVGWGKVAYLQSRYRLQDKQILMVAVPHLSTYRIFGRPDSQYAVEQLTDSIIESLLEDSSKR